MALSKEVVLKKDFLYPPGGILVWTIIVTELVTFMAALSVFLIERRANLEVFQNSQALMHRGLGAFNTVVLLAGGFFMARSLFFLKKNQKDKSFQAVLISIALGVLFLVVKGYEYFDKIQHGLTLRHSSFFTYYWLITGFHFLHVAVAVVILGFLAKGIRSGEYHADNFEDVSAGAAFWHMCDLIWLLVFPLLYLVGGV